MKFLQLFQTQYKLPKTVTLDKATVKKIGEILNITNPNHLAHFLGQVHHESGGFNSSRESLNYSATALLTTFGRHRITQQEAIKYGRTSEQRANQQAIANALYGGEWGRKNLGNTQPNDGWLFRGNGSLQLTGRANHQLFANAVNDQNIMTIPDLVNEKYYFESGKFFFDRNKLWQYCNDVSDDSILTVSKAVNIGNVKTTATPKGMPDRIKQTKHILELLK